MADVLRAEEKEKWLCQVLFFLERLNEVSQAWITKMKFSPATITETGFAVLKRNMFRVGPLTKSSLCNVVGSCWGRNHLRNLLTDIEKQYCEYRAYKRRPCHKTFCPAWTWLQPKIMFLFPRQFLSLKIIHPFFFSPRFLPFDSVLLFFFVGRQEMFPKRRKQETCAAARGLTRSRSALCQWFNMISWESDRH